MARAVPLSSLRLRAPPEHGRKIPFLAHGKWIGNRGDVLTVVQRPEGPAHMVWRDYSNHEIYAGARASAANSAGLFINPKKEWESEEQYPP
ncbi:hypothetical protein MY1884_007322 [Beauveria asiatica]